MLYEEARQEILDVCRRMVRKGYFLGTWGNVSVRIGDHIVLTPSKVEYGSMRLEDFVVIDLEGNKVEGSRTPTSEKEVHRQIYLVRDDIKAVIHAHTQKAMAVSALPISSVPCMVEEMSQLFGGKIPLSRQYIPAEQHQSLGRGAAEVIEDKNGLIQRNHGPVACGRNLSEAALTVDVMEKACAIYLDIINRPIKEIPSRFVQSERERFLFKYGHENT